MPAAGRIGDWVASMQVLGGILQRLALLALPIGIVLELTNSITLGEMLLMMLAGATAFAVGRIIEGYARR